VIAPKTPKPTRAEEKAAYLAATTRDENRCVMCGKSGTVQRDHRQGRQSGNTVAENLHLLCPRDHQWKTEHPQQAELEGYSVPRWASPAAWPGRRLVLTEFGAELIWVLYTPIDAAGNAHWFEISVHDAKRRMNGDGKVF
jgi:hypothetical protein